MLTSRRLCNYRLEGDLCKLADNSLDAYGLGEVADQSKTTPASTLLYRPIVMLIYMADLHEVNQVHSWHVLGPPSLP